MSLDVLSIATYAAFERACQSSQNLWDTQAKLAELLLIAEGSPWTGQLRKHLGEGAVPGGPIFQDWVKKLYVLRGSVAHGKPPPMHGPWSQDELLLAGAFVFPLVLKCLLSSKGRYPLTREDIADVLGLERLLGAQPFFPVRSEGEDEFQWRKRCGWPSTMGEIAGAVVDISLHQTLTTTLNEIHAREAGAE